ncbi:MAG: lipoprotein-releasing ABC transporter permease subunit [Alphaproteobacteria bacterium]
MIFGPFERLVAFRYLRARRQEGFVSVIAVISVLGIMLGVMALIIVMAVMNGFRQELLSRILGVNGHLTVYGISKPIENYEALTDQLAGLPGVRLVTPQVQGQVMIVAAGAASGGLVRGMRPADLEARELIAGNITAGDLSAFTEDGDAVLIGSRMAQKLGLKIGDSLTVISPQGTTTVMGTVPRMKSYRIAALFQVGMYEYDSTFIYMPLAAAQLFFRLPNQVNGIEVFAENPDLVRDLRWRIGQELGPGYRTLDWQQANSSFFNAIQVERNVMFLILTLIMLVAALNIISSLIMLVKDKGRDIAVLRTMGATRGMVMRIFLLSGASVGLIGTLAGFVLGVAFCLNIQTIQGWLEGLTGTDLWNAEVRFLTQIPAVIDWTEVATVLAMALGLSFAATIYPAWRAARLDPVEALRYE